MTARWLAAFAAVDLATALLHRKAAPSPTGFDHERIPAGALSGELRHCPACGYTRYFELIGDVAECVPRGHRVPA